MTLLQHGTLLITTIGTKKLKDTSMKLLKPIKFVSSPTLPSKPMAFLALSPSQLMDGSIYNFPQRTIAVNAAKASDQ
jgi:hypothetical protein